MADNIWTLSARKALGYVLEVGMAAQTPAIAISWPDKSFDPKDHVEYVRFSIHRAKDRVRTIGPNARIEGAGFAKVGVFTRMGQTQDRNDRIAGIVRGLFPYNAKLDRDGIRVTIDTTDHGDFVPVNGWGYSPVDVNWSVWRTT